MNKIYTIVFMLLIGLVACEGPVGPPGLPGPRGPQGLPGVDGLNGEIPYLFEYVITFEPSSEYSVLLPFPDPVDFPVYESDVVLVYLLWNVEVIDGEEVDIWRLLPQSQMMEFGWLQYNFDFTVKDVSVFMESDFPLTQLGTDYTDDQVVRIVVVPGQFLTNGRVNLNNYHAVEEALGLPEKELPEGYALTGSR